MANREQENQEQAPVALPYWVNDVEFKYSNVCFLWGNVKDVHVAFGEQMYNSNVVSGPGVSMSIPQAKLFCQDLMRVLERVELMYGAVNMDMKERQLDS